MKKLVAVLAVLLAATAVAFGAAALATDKLPKCSKPDCRAIGCPADVLCSAGTGVKTCAEVCNGK